MKPVFVNPTALPLLDAQALRAAVSGSVGCAHCAALVCLGWESQTAPLGPPLLEPVGTLRDPAVEEPTLTEAHEPVHAPAPTEAAAESAQDTQRAGTHDTHYWHPRAPVATAFFPYNRATVWRCLQCRRGFLQYTEFGGYYVDHRLRAIDPALIR